MMLTEPYVTNIVRQEGADGTYWLIAVAQFPDDGSLSTWYFQGDPEGHVIGVMREDGTHWTFKSTVMARWGNMLTPEWVVNWYEQDPEGDAGLVRSISQAATPRRQVKYAEVVPVSEPSANPAYVPMDPKGKRTVMQILLLIVILIPVLLYLSDSRIHTTPDGSPPPNSIGAQAASAPSPANAAAYLMTLPTTGNLILEPENAPLTGMRAGPSVDNLTPMIATYCDDFAQGTMASTLEADSPYYADTTQVLLSAALEYGCPQYASTRGDILPSLTP